MPNDELQKLAAALADCGKALLKISEVMAVKEDNPSASEAKSEKLEKPLTLEDVRKVAADKSRQGFTDEVRSLIQKYGADKLSGIDAAQYEAVPEGTGGDWPCRINMRCCPHLLATAGWPARRLRRNVPSCRIPPVNSPARERMPIRSANSR
jgi:hypothetical protein